ncbi:MAG TPA: heavy metal translocating P-type ATPase metal-binding domain-containing protein [Chthoniobacter sp.]|nr:heavy metal translocating P-type ATPase metal-binding domain-containing protein [Chthoniobacter sp.]
MQAAIDQRVCIHCGTPFCPTAHRRDFCCTGCQFVHDLIAKNGLGQFYDLQEGVLPPVASLVFQKRDYTWLEELAAQTAGPLHLDIQGLSCIGCTWLIERLFLRHPGALFIRIDPALGQLELQGEANSFDLVAFARDLQSYGYLVGPPGKSAPTNRALNLRLGLCAALALNTMLFTLPRYLGMSVDFEFAPLFDRLTFLFGTLSFLIGGSYFFVRSWHSLRQDVLHIDLPISLGLLAAYAGSVFAWMRNAHGFVYFDFVATFSFLMLVGRWLQQKAIERNRRQLLSAMAEPPRVRDAATGERLDAGDIRSGRTFVVEPGQTVPVRSRLHSASALLGLEWISGESDITIAGRGRIVSAGAVNRGQDAIALEALEPWADSLLAKLLVITPGPAPRDARRERFLRIYIVAVIAIGTLAFAGWWVMTGALLPALQVFISVLVVSCPCASGVALPLANDLATSGLRRFGVFVRNAELWAKLDRVRNVLFDKTGTLTLETISLRNPEALCALSAEERAVLLAIVYDSPHPVSGCLREQLLADRVEAAALARATETFGFGLDLRHAGSLWRLGRPEWSGVQESADCVFTRDGLLLASFRFGEEPRTDALTEVRALEARNCRIFILSGDRHAKVESMGRRLGLPQERCFGQLSPEQKAEWVASFDRRDSLYIGDGANDSLAFDAAWCSGTPAIDRGLLEQKADFYFLGRGLGGVRALLQAAARRRLVAGAVIAFAIGYNVIAIALSLAGKMSPLLAAILMPSSSLVSLAIVFGWLGRRGSRSRRS